MQVVTLHGKAGSGKTTLLNLMETYANTNTLRAVYRSSKQNLGVMLRETKAEVLLVDEVPADKVAELTEVIKDFPGYAFFAIQS